MLHGRMLRFGEVGMDECEIINSSGLALEFQCRVRDKYELKRSYEGRLGRIFKRDRTSHIAFEVHWTIVARPHRFRRRIARMHQDRNVVDDS